MPPSDPYPRGASGPISFQDSFPVTLQDADLARVPIALDCDGGGKVAVVWASGAQQDILLTPGQPYLCRPHRVKAPSAGDAATGVFALL